MPEFPDVTVYIDALVERVLNQTIQKIRIGSPFVLRSFAPPIRSAEGSKVLALHRLGKRIVFELEDELFLVVHLMIAGRFHWKPQGAKIARKYGQAAFDFSNGTLLLTEAGTKKRASIHLVHGAAALQEHDPGGLEVLDAGLDAFRAALTRLLTTRQLFFLTHSTLGILIVHAFGGGLGTLLTSGDSRMKDRIRKLSTASLAVVAWLASAVGTWFGYAGYRAKVPPGGDITMYPREYLLNSPQLAFWETFAMEWKVHIGWTTPFLATAVAFTALRYRRRLVADRLVRKVMTIMLLLAFAGALVAAGLGAVVNVTAPNDFMHRGWSP